MIQQVRMEITLEDGMNRTERLIKRGGDILLSVVLLGLLWPVFLVIGFLVDIMHRVLDPRLGDDREERR